MTSVESGPSARPHASRRNPAKARPSPGRGKRGRVPDALGLEGGGDLVEFDPAFEPGVREQPCRHRARFVLFDDRRDCFHRLETGPPWKAHRTAARVGSKVARIRQPRSSRRWPSRWRRTDCSARSTPMERKLRPLVWAIEFEEVSLHANPPVPSRCEPRWENRRSQGKRLPRRSRPTRELVDRGTSPRRVKAPAIRESGFRSRTGIPRCGRSGTEVPVVAASRHAG